MNLIFIIIMLFIVSCITKPYCQIALDFLSRDKALTKDEIEAEAVKLGKSPILMWHIYCQIAKKEAKKRRKKEVKKYNRHVKKLN